MRSNSAIAKLSSVSSGEQCLDMHFYPQEVVQFQPQHHAYLSRSVDNVFLLSKQMYGRHPQVSVNSWIRSSSRPPTSVARGRLHDFSIHNTVNITFSNELIFSISSVPKYEWNIS